MKILFLFGCLLTNPLAFAATVKSDLVPTNQIKAFFELVATPNNSRVLLAATLETLAGDDIVLTEDETLQVSVADEVLRYKPDSNNTLPYIPGALYKLQWTRFNGEVLSSELHIVKPWKFTFPTGGSTHLRAEPVTLYWDPIAADDYGYEWLEGDAEGYDVFCPIGEGYSVHVNLAGSYAQFPPHDYGCTRETFVTLKLFLATKGTPIPGLKGDGFASSFPNVIHFQYAPDYFQGAR